MARLARGPSAAARQAISHPPKSMPTTRSRVSAREEPPAASFDAAFGDSFEEPKEPELESYQNTIYYFFFCIGCNCLTAFSVFSFCPAALKLAPRPVRRSRTPRDEVKF